jgi:Tol biopolymer transport system component
VPGDTNGANRDIFVRDRQSGQTELVSVSSAGVQGNYGSSNPTISADGRFVAFESSASNLVPGDTNGANGDIFVHDRETGQTERVSVSSAGAQGNYGSVDPTISADGRFVAFRSEANNLVPGDTNDRPDVFVRDRQTGETERVSVSSAGTQGNGHSVHPTISADGRFVAFESSASNLVPGDTNGANGDIFVALNVLRSIPLPPNATPQPNYFTTATPTLTWNRVTWATSYIIEIDADPNFGTVGRYTRTANGLSHTVETPLVDGVWYWRIRAIGTSGPGQWSTPERFVVDAP